MRRRGLALAACLVGCLSFLSAGAGEGLVEPGTRVDLAGNSLVVIVPKGAKDRPAALNDLTDAKYGRIALADPVAVPAGRYAKAALDKVGLFEGLKARIVAAQDVRTAL